MPMRATAPRPALPTASVRRSRCSRWWFPRPTPPWRRSRQGPPSHARSPRRQVGPVLDLDLDLEPDPDPDQEPDQDQAAALMTTMTTAVAVAAAAKPVTVTQAAKPATEARAAKPAT